MKLIAMIETVPADRSGHPDRRTDEISVQTQDYDAGYDQLCSQIPEGWRMVHVRRDDYGI